MGRNGEDSLVEPKKESFEGAMIPIRTRELVINDALFELMKNWYPVTTDSFLGMPIKLNKYIQRDRIICVDSEGKIIYIVKI